MTTTTVTNFRQNVFEYLHSAIEYNDVIDVTTKEGSAVVMSKEEYNAMVETLSLLHIPGMPERFFEAATAKKEDLIPLEQVEW